MTLPLVWTLSAASCGSAGDVEVFARPDGAPEGAPALLDFFLLSEQSRSDPGWTGSAYGTGPPAGSNYTTEVVDCDAEGRRCRFRGPVRGDQAVVSQRCLDDVTETCADDSDCSGGRCRFTFPPFSSFDTPTCNLAYFEPSGQDDPSPLFGIIDLWTGDIDYSVLSSRVAISLAGACENCLGDPEVKDGYYVATLGLLTCLPPTGDPLLDGIAGFPGPLFYQTAFRVTPRYQ